MKKAVVFLATIFVSILLSARIGAEAAVTVKFDGNGGTSPSSIQVQYNQCLSSSQIPSSTRTGYTFNGWYTDKVTGTQLTTTTKITTSCTYYAHWTAKAQYTVTFDANGGSVSERTRKVYSGDPIGTLPTPSRKGYTFKGWWYTDTAEISGSTRVYSNTTYKAHWSVNSYTVTFNNNGSTSTKSVLYDHTLGSLPEPSRTGYTFAGWYTSGGSRAYSSTTITGSVTYYAKWNPKSYTVTFDSNGGTSVASRQVTYGSAVGTLPVPAREGHSFDGWWYTDTAQINENTPIYGDTTFKAYWKADLCTVTFDGNGGTDSQKNVVYGGTLGELPVSKRTGYTFLGWYPSPSDGAKITEDTVIKGASIFYAHWTKEQYTITFDGNGGNPVKSIKMINFDDPVGSFPNVSKEHYVLTGWYRGKEADSEKISETTPVKGTTTFYAQWKEAVCKVTFDVNGGYGQANIPAKSLYWGEEFGTELPIAPGAQNGMYFVGWFDDRLNGTQYTGESPVPKQDELKLYAHYSSVRYTIVFDSNGGTGSMNPLENCVYGVSYKLPQNGFERDGFEFDGWVVTNGIAAEDVFADGELVSDLANQNGYIVKLRAKWKLDTRTYKITFDLQNVGSLESGQDISIFVKYLKKGEAYGDLPENIKCREYGNGVVGYRFDGWYTEDDIRISKYSVFMGDSDQVLYAHYKAYECTVTFDANGGIDKNGLSSIKRTYYFTQPYGELPEAPEAPQGMKFKGWFTEPVGGKEITAESQVDIITDHTLYAQWQSVLLSEDFIFVTNQMGGINYFPYSESKYKSMFEKYTEEKDVNGNPIYGKDNLYKSNPEIISSLSASDIYARAAEQALLFHGNVAGQNLLNFLKVNRSGPKLYFYGHSQGVDYAVHDASVLSDIFTSSISYTQDKLEETSTDIFNEAFRIIDGEDSFIIASAPDKIKHGSFGQSGANKILDAFKFAGIHSFDISGLLSVDFDGTNYHIRYKWYIHDYYDWENEDNIGGLVNVQELYKLTLYGLGKFYFNIYSRDVEFVFETSGNKEEDLQRAIKIATGEESSGSECSYYEYHWADSTQGTNFNWLPDKNIEEDTAEPTPTAPVADENVVTTTPAPVVTPAPTQAPVATTTPAPVVTPVPTQAPVATTTPVPVVTPVPTQAPVATTTPVPVVTPVPTQTSVATTTSAPVVTPVPTQTSVATTTPAPVVTPTATPAVIRNETGFVSLIIVSEKVADAVLTEEEEARMEAGASITVEAESETVKTTKKDKKTANAAANDIKQQLVDSGAATKKAANKADITISQTYDIDITKQVGDGEKTEVTDTNGLTVPVTVSVSNDLILASTKEKRVYYMVGTDSDGNAVASEATLDKSSNTLTFESTGSGRATLVYTDVPYFVEEGTILRTSNALNAVYVVTKSGNVNGKAGDVSYVDAQTDKASATIKATVKLAGIRYNVTGIADKEFEDNAKLRKVTIGKNVASIGENAFAGCSNLKTIIINSKKLDAENVDASAFDGISKNAVVKVPKGYAKKYRAMFKELGIDVKVKVNK